MQRFAPRYPHRLFDLIETLDDESESLAEIVRRVGTAAEREGITRPSPVHVRALLAELRAQRRDEREIRKAALETVERLVTAQFDAHTVHRPVVRALDQAEVRARRRGR